MTLKEKFEYVLHNWIDKDYNRLHVANELEIDSDDYAIGFLKWYVQEYSQNEIEYLLEEYKKEKGL